MDTVRFCAPLLTWSNGSHSGIRYVVILGEAADSITLHERVRRLELGQRRGFGSVKVAAEIGASRWSTSFFPQKGDTWFLPIKAPVCRAEALEAGNEVEVRLTLL